MQVWGVLLGVLLVEQDMEELALSFRVTTPYPLLVKEGTKGRSLAFNDDNVKVIFLRVKEQRFAQEVGRKA